MKRPPPRAHLRDPAAIPESVVTVYARMSRKDDQVAARQFLASMPPPYYKRFALYGEIEETISTVVAGEIPYEFQFAGETTGTLVIGVPEEMIDWFTAEHFDIIRKRLETIAPRIVSVGVMPLSDLSGSMHPFSKGRDIWAA